MREDELRKHVECSICDKKIGHTGVPIFWTVKIERHGVKYDAVTRQQGLTDMLGGSAMLARVMGPDEDMTTPLIDPVTATVCEECSTGHVCIAQMAEKLDEDEEEDEDGDS